MRKLLIYLTLSCPTLGVAAEEAQIEDTHCLVHGTYVWQKKPAFNAQTGATHPLNQAEKNYSMNVVLHLAKRVWTGGEVYFNAEIEQGVPFAGMADVGGPTSGEDAGNLGKPTLFYPRLLLRQTWALGGGTERIDPSENQLAGMTDKNRFVLTAGRFSLMDVFGKNSYTFDPTIHFMNWSNTTYAAYDYAGDAHGYSVGVAGEWYQDDWTLRAGRVAVPTVQHALSLEANVFNRYGDQLEVEHRHQLAGQAGKMRLLMWRNRGVMGSFNAAVAYKSLNNQVPDVALVRGERIKYGVGVDVEQAITPDLGAFFRLMQSDGRSETLSYLEVDESAAAGIALKGSGWQHADDTLGLVLKENALSTDRRAYLQAGGVSVFNTQGAFQYRPEVIFESYYNWQFAQAAWLTLDYQHIINPSYNAYRGPVDVYGVRLHLEY